MSTLYLMEQGSVLHKRSERLEVTKDGKRLLQVPAMKVEQVVVFGNIQVTTPALAYLLKEGIDLAFLSSRGVFRGRLQTPHSRNIYLRWAQYERGRDPRFQLQVARVIVAGKITNARTQCLRFQRAGHVKYIDRALDRLDDLRRQAAQAELASLRGIEGAAAGLYYAILRQVLQARLDFPRRTRRPPRDPVNVLLSLAYTLLLNSVLAGVEVVGLDPYMGFYHAEKYGRPALALDIMEEFRPIVADALVVMLLTKRVISADDFGEEFGQIRLSYGGQRRFLREWADKLNDEIVHPYFDYAATYARCIELQARILAKVITGELPEYLPFRTR
jgi:CRISPR-associated protein Cas1